MSGSANDVDAEELYIKVADIARKNPKEFAKKCNEIGIFYHGELNEFNTIMCVGDIQEAFGFGATVDMVDALLNYGNRKSEDTKNRYENTKHEGDLKQEYLPPVGVELSARLCFPPDASNIPSAALVNDY